VFNVGPLELIVVLIIALIVLGPKRLPEVARSVGRGLREFRNAIDREHDDEDEEHHYDEEPKPKPAVPAAGETTPAVPATSDPKADAPTAAAPKPAAPASPPAYQKDAESSEPSSSSSDRV
jgi:TatA/E family protein of Tat protein translocase